MPSHSSERMFLIVCNFESSQSIPLDLIGREATPHKQQHPIVMRCQVIYSYNREGKIDLKIITFAVKCTGRKKYRSFALGDN